MFQNFIDLVSHNQFNTSIWGDEGFSAILSFKSLPEIITIIATDTSPPLWNISEWIVFNTLGTDEVYIRGLAFLFYALSCLFAYKIAKTLFTSKTALWSTALTALNPFFFIYAFEGRMYSILALGVTASMYFFIKLQKGEDERRFAMLGYVIATSWALYSHHFAFFALFVQGLWFLYRLLSRKTSMVKRLFKAFLIVGILYIPWMLPLYRQTTMVGGGFWLPTPDIYDLRTLFYDYLAQGIKYPEIIIPYSDYKIIDLALWLTLIALVMRRWHRRFKNSFFLVLWATVPILATWGISQVFQSIFFNRYLLYAIPPMMIILASNRRKYSTIVLGLIIAVFAIIDFNYFVNPTKLPFREMSQYVKETREEGDFIINWNDGAHHIWETKYYGIGGPIYIPDGGDLPFFVGTALMEEDDIIREIPDSVNRLGVVTSGKLENINVPEEFVEEDVKQMRELKFVWYTKNQDDQITE